MKCPVCGALDSRVLDSRPVEDGASIRRRRECVNCGKRFTTYEMVETVPITVIKKDGRREPFDRHKLKNGLNNACMKRNVDVEKICGRYTQSVREGRSCERRKSKEALMKWASICMTNANSTHSTAGTTLRQKTSPVRA